MAEKPVLYGFDGSTYVRAVRTVMHAKGIGYEQVPVNVLEGEPRRPEHLKRHPFGKVPVLDIDGMRLLETAAINQYLDETREGPSFTPRDPKNRARMRMAIGLIDSFGYAALLGSAGYHLFPEFLGNPSEEQHRATVEQAEKLLRLLMEKKGNDPWLAGGELSLADVHLGPIVFYVSLTPEKEKLIKGATAEWWQRIGGLESFKATEPNLG